MVGGQEVAVGVVCGLKTNRIVSAAREHGGYGPVRHVSLENCRDKGPDCRRDLGPVDDSRSEAARRRRLLRQLSGFNSPSHGAILLAFGLDQGRGVEKPETGSVVLENVKPSDLPEAWRKRVKAGAEERLTVTIAKRPSRASASRPRDSKRPNASFGMWADRVQIDPAAYVRALRRPRHAH